MDSEVSNNDEAARRLAQHTVAEVGQLAREHESLVNRVTDAKKALEISAQTYRREWAGWLDQSKTILEEMRLWRMSLDSEMNHSLIKFKDIRKFFLSDEHALEVARLKEFVELCERLKILKESGFLDSVADTILRLDAK